MKYYQMTIHTVTDAVEALSSALNDIGTGGVEIFDPKDILLQDKSPTSWDYIDEDLLKDLSRDEVLVRAYFPQDQLSSPQALEDMVLKIRHILDRIALYLPIGTGKIDTALLNDQDYLNAWKASYRPFRLGDHLYVCPSWLTPQPSSGDILIHMDPGMAFGTGTHATTSLCMTEIEKLVRHGDTVYDIGCGSGILGITAAKVGAAHVVCSDLDPEAVRTATENIAQNGVSERVKAVQGDLTQVSDFQEGAADVICANIIADVIIALAPQAKAYLKKGGYFIASGILSERKDEVVQALRQSDYEVLRVKEQGSWCCAVSRA